ncbi:MAG: outer membrane lipoprotein carrier protein LolA [Gammaproteobacteria bacterium]|nr:outer membrane lipoprotein carrier protein LolA [Gammaproteobacteria bacterium]
MIRELVGLLCVCWSCLLVASPIEDLTRLLEPYQSFSAEFKQSTLDQKGAPINQMTGELSIASPSIFYWKTYPPFSQVIVADNEVLWIFDEDLYQVQVRPIDDAITASPAAILTGGPDTLGSRFRVTDERKNTISVFRLVPLATDEVTRQIVLRFDGDRLVDLSIEDALGNRSLVTLISVTHDQPSPERFQFTPPDDADVIYALGEQR